MPALRGRWGFAAYDPAPLARRGGRGRVVFYYWYRRSGLLYETVFAEPAFGDCFRGFPFYFDRVIELA